MLVNTHFSLSADSCKTLFSKYLDFDMCDFVAYIDKNDIGNNALHLSSKEIRMEFDNAKIKEILIDAFNKDCDTKIDNVCVCVINNTERNRQYVSIDCDMSKEYIKSIVDIIG